ncbi:hypothetical protein LAZ67_3001916, partial [Cordylochernes scorpioides]
MSIVEETLASSTSSAKNATRVDLDAFIEGHPSVSFAETDALGLGREEVLDLLSSRTKAQRKGPLLSPPQCDALVGLIGQILDLRPGAASNLYKVLGQVKAELRTTPAVPPTPPLPAPQPAKPVPPAPHKKKSTPARTTPPLPLPDPMEEKDLMPEVGIIFRKMIFDPGAGPFLESGIQLDDIMPAVLYSEDREELLEQLSPENKSVLAGFLDVVLEYTRNNHPTVHKEIYGLRVDAESPSKAVQKPVRHSVQDQTCAELSAKEDLQRKISNNLCAKQNYANPPTGVKDANLAAARGDVTTGSAAATSSNGAARVMGNWADYTEDQGPGEDDDFTVVKNKKRRRESPGSPAAAAPSSGTRGAGATRRPRSSTGWAPRAEEVRTTRAHIAEARARQASSTEDHCVFVERSPFGRVTSIAPKLMKAGPYIYNDGRREAFIILREGMTIERLPTRLDITIKGEAWPAYLSSRIRCSRCRGQGHRRANCPLLARRTTAPGPATPTSPTSVPPETVPRLPQQPSAQPPPPASPSPTMEVSDVPPTSRAALHPPAALRQSPPAPSALPAEDAPPAPPPVTPAPSLRTPGSREPAAPTPDVEMSIVETSASFTSTAKNATRIDLDAFIERHPSVSFAETDALGLGREEVLDLLSSRTKTQRSVPLLPPSQCDALAGLIRQILDLRPGAASNLYKVLGQVKAELRTTPAVPPTPPLPAPRPAETAPPAPQGEESAPAEVAYPPPLPVKMTDEARKKWFLDLFKELNYKTVLATLLGWTTPEQIIHAALHSGEKRNDFLNAHPNQRSILVNFLGSVIERARGEQLRILQIRRLAVKMQIRRRRQTEIDTPFNGAIKAQRSWANSSKDVNPASEDGFTIVQGKKRRRGSADSPAAAAHSSNARRSGTNRRQRSSTERVPRAQEIKTTRTHIVEARARQASSTEEQCLYVEHCPELEPYHFLKAIDEMVGGTSDVVQVTKMNGLCLLGLANKALAERLINEGLKVDGMLLKTFPFYRRAAKLTIGNLPFFVKDASVIDALLPYGRVTSIIPKQLKAGRYVYTDGRREACIVPHDGINIEFIPARLDIKIKGEAWPIYLTSGIRCSRCRGQGHRRANCPLLTGQSITSRRASLPSTTNLPPSTVAGLPGQSSAAATAPAPTSPASRLSGAQPDARAASPPSTAPRPSTSAPPASSVQVAAPVPPSVAPAPVDPASPRSAATEPTPPARPDFIAPCGPLPAQETLGPATHTPDVDMTPTEETSASSPAAVFPTLPLPAPQPAGPTPSAPHKEEPTPAMTPPSPPPAPMEEDLPPDSDECIFRIYREIPSSQVNLGSLVDEEITWTDIIDAILHPQSRAPFLARLSPILKKNHAVFLEAAIERAQDSHPRILS